VATDELTVRTPRLDLIATTVAHLDAELPPRDRAAPHEQLGALLGALVPASWPPGQYDDNAMRFFRSRLVAEGPRAIGWYAWYAVLRSSEYTARILVASGGYMGPPADGRVEIGYSVVPEWRGRGIATELIAALAARALSERGVSRVVAHVAPDNIPSQRALVRAGFVFCGNTLDPTMCRFERRASPRS
jgi:RimJ/RimL family protein N-acetyltransferase